MHLSNRMIGLVFSVLIFLFISLDVFADVNKNNFETILSIADIHFDPFIACNKAIPCPLIQKLRSTPVSGWPKLLTSYDIKPVKYGMDTNYALLSSAVLAVKKVGEEKHPKFILILGDLLGHEFRRNYKLFSKDKSRSGYQSFVKKTFQFLASEINKAFPATDVYMAVGNNDTYSNDYFSQPNGAFFHDIMEIYASLVKNQINSSRLRQQASTAGYYAVDIAGKKNIRLVMLNSVLFSNKSNEKAVAQAANKELEWLTNELETIKQKGQKAIIAMHIPPSIDIYATARFRLFTLLELWRPQFLTRFIDTLHDYAPNIMAVFAAHIHSDWFQILTFNDTDAEVPMAGVPSISPIFGNYPTFKTYNYNSQTYRLGDAQVYYYPLDKREWGMQYSDGKFNSSDCHKCPTPWQRPLVIN